MKMIGLCTRVFLFTFAFAPLAFAQPSQATDKNGEVIAWIEAIDNFEIKVAELSSTKEVNTEVKNYSTMLYDDHSKNLKEATALSEKLDEKPVETKALTGFKKDGANQLTQLSKLNNNTFQVKFINAMIAGHAGALQKVDNDLMKKVSNDELKTFLIATRTMIAHHLERAKEIKKNMQKS